MSKDESKQKDLWDIIGTDKARGGDHSSLFEQVQLVHRALPESSWELIDLRTEFCGKDLAAPLWLSPPAFVPRDPAFEECLARMAQKHGLALCTGSIAPLLSDPSRKTEFELRALAPDVLLMAGIGVHELASFGPGQVVEAARSIGADGLSVFLKGAWAMLEGESRPDLRGAVATISTLCASDPNLPVLVKESGCGLSYLDGAFLQAIGVRRVEVGGLGSSSPFAMAAHSENESLARLGEMLSNWGVPAAAATDWLSTQGFEVVASGGVRGAMDAAAALALGAHMIGLTDPLVRTYRKGGPQRVDAFIAELLDGLKAVLLLCGVRKPKDMAGVPRIVGSQLSRWIAAGPSAL
ncbi:MAG: alpha-hydroxy-acid oxidizing protein [Myxococcota bacterium]|jgi:isopentenyl-diphosphate delta-isomerase|nr:alpha-hydroxy-acid oxidizing protein [Myxococcota bacterium]